MIAADELRASLVQLKLLLTPGSAEPLPVRTDQIAGTRVPPEAGVRRGRGRELRRREGGSADLVFDVGDARRVDGSDLLELDDAVLEPIEQALAGAHDRGSDRYVDLVHQSRG